MKLLRMAQFGRCYWITYAKIPPEGGTTGVWNTVQQPVFLSILSLHFEQREDGTWVRQL